MPRRIALVSRAHRDRSVLADYLRISGFDVHVCDELAITSSFRALILLGHEMSADDLRTQIRGWMKSSRTHVIIIVTSKPAAIEELRALYNGRLFVFAAPVFGWDVVDALRATEPPRPRSA